jgi:hypothetical protein
MKKTILLGEKGVVSTKTSASLFGILGLIWFILGSIEIYEQVTSIGSSGYLIIGFVFILYSIITFTVNPFAPKVTISDSEIKIKRTVFSGAIRILWISILSIEFDQYMITFHLTDKVEEFSYGTNAETSIEIKSNIREVAENKNIRVIGG